MVRVVCAVFLFPVFSVSAQEKKEPVSLKAEGRLVCLLEEMEQAYQAEVPPIHAHVVGFKVKGKLPEGRVRYYTLVRTALSDALFVDKRFWGRDLRLRCTLSRRHQSYFRG